MICEEARNIHDEANFLSEVNFPQTYTNKLKIPRTPQAAFFVAAADPYVITGLDVFAVMT